MATDKNIMQWALWPARNIHWDNLSIEESVLKAENSDVLGLSNFNYWPLFKGILIIFVHDT